MRQREAELDALGVQVVVVTFQSGFLVDVYIRETELRWPILVDKSLELYQSYGMGRGRWLNIWVPATWWAYLKLLVRGRRLPLSSVKGLPADGSSADVNQPYAIVDPMTKKELAIIDTTGQITSLTEQEANILVTKKELIVRRTNLDTRSLPFDPDIDFTLDQHKVTRWLNTLRRVTAVWIYPLALLGSWFFRVIQMLIYALIGLQFARILQSRRTYDSLLRLSAVAVTPAIIVQTILGVAEIQIPMPGLCYFLAAMCCLFFGIKSAALSAEAASEEDSGSPGMTHIE
ncbi:MAG: DUF1189 family protein [Planctomycetes bacterium]|nr:DUF1189 family protein [Planctomycetota bacterium]